MDLWEQGHFFAHQIDGMPHQRRLFLHLAETLKHFAACIDDDASIIEHEGRSALEPGKNRGDELVEIFSERERVAPQEFYGRPRLLECESRIDGGADTLHEA